MKASDSETSVQNNFIIRFMLVCLIFLNWAIIKEYRFSLFIFYLSIKYFNWKNMKVYLLFHQKMERNFIAPPPHQCCECHVKNGISKIFVKCFSKEQETYVEIFFHREKKFFKTFDKLELFACLETLLNSWARGFVV